MITIPLSTEDLTKVRPAPSPLWETVASFGVLLHQGRDTVQAPLGNPAFKDFEADSDSTVAKRLRQAAVRAIEAGLLGGGTRR